MGPDDAVYVTGENMSPGLATENAWIRQPQSYSSYVAKISPAGDRIEYFTYIGARGGYSSTSAIGAGEVRNNRVRRTRPLFTISVPMSVVSG